MKFFVVILIFFLSNLKPAEAFLNIEALRYKKEEGFFGKTQLNFSGASGNTEKVNGLFSTQNLFKEHKNEWIQILNYSYGEVSKEKNTNKGSFHLRYSRGFTSSLFLENFYQIQFDDFKKLTQRRLVGLGLREKLFSDKKSHLFLGQSLMYEYENFEELIINEVLRLNFYSAFNYDVSDTSNYNLVLYYQPKLNDWSDFRMIVNTGITFSIWKGIGFNVLLSYAYDTTVPADVEKGDFTYFTGLSVSY